MFIKINGITYPDTTRTRTYNRDVIFAGDNIAEIPEVDSVISTYRNDGFLMAEDNPNDYLRIVRDENSIMLTNTPEPDPDEEVSEE